MTTHLLRGVRKALPVLRKTGNELPPMPPSKKLKCFSNTFGDFSKTPDVTGRWTWSHPEVIDVFYYPLVLVWGGGMSP